MSSLLPLLKTEASEGGMGSANTTSLSEHFPKSFTWSVDNASYRKEALKLLLSDESVTITIAGSDPTTGNDYESSYWVNGTGYKRGFGSSENLSIQAPSYATVPLVSDEGDGLPETPYYPNRGSAIDADPSKLPLVTSNRTPVATNDLSSIKVAGSSGDVTTKDPKGTSLNGNVVDSSFNPETGKLNLTPGNSRMTDTSGLTKFGE